MERIQIEQLVEKEKTLSTRSKLFEVVCPAPRDIWREVYWQDPDSLATQSPEWVDTVCQVTNGEDASRLYCFKNGKRIILPLVRNKTLLGAVATLSSFRNSWGIGGLLSSDAISVQELKIILSDLNQQKEIRYGIRPNPLVGPLWESAKLHSIEAIPRRAHVLDLGGGFSYIWEKQFRSVTRTAVRKAERSGLVVEKDTTGRLLPVFYQLFEKSLERWGLQQHEPLFLTRLRGHLRDPYSKYQRMSSNLKTTLQIWIAWLDGQAAAGIIVLQGANAYYTRGAMDKSLAGPSRANDLLHRMAIEDACQAGSRYYHMGESGLSKSLSSFKENFGAKAYDYPEIYHERLPLTQLDRNLRRVIKTIVGFQDA